MEKDLKCPQCGAEVEVDQRICAWCGADLPAMSAKTPPEATPKRPVAGPPPPISTTPPPRAPNASSAIPGTVTLSVEEARNLARSGNLGSALSAFQDLVSRDPSNQEALFGIGGVHFKQGDKRKAAEAWSRLKRMNPDYPHIDSWLAKVEEHPIQKPSAPPPAPRPVPPSPQTASPPAPIKPPVKTRVMPVFEEEDKPGDEDWQRQSVRVEAPEATIETPKTLTAPPDVKEPLPEFKPNPIPIWVTPLSWLLVLGYAALFVGVYFLIW